MSASNPLEFSIVIPTYNRPERLEQCLESLARLTYPRDRFEVIVVDDGSPTSLESIADKFAQRLPLRMLRQENAGPASARNAGAAAARGKYLAFTDDDCQPNPDWLDTLAEAIAGRPNALVGGHTENALAENLFSSASQLLVDYLYDYYDRIGGQPLFFTSNNFALPRALFERLGGFDANFPLAAGEDREFCDRWLYHDLALHYAPRMQIRHFHSLALASFWRQHFNYGRGAYYFHKARSQRQSGPIEIEPLSFYWSLVTYPFRCRNILQASGLSGLLLLSQVANAAGFFWERKYGPKTISFDGTAPTTLS